MSSQLRGGYESESVIPFAPAAKNQVLSAATVEFGKSIQKTRRRVSIRRDGEDFVVVILDQDLVVFRNNDARALRKVCRSLRWEIAIDSCRLSADGPCA
jgi:hypothetical protein